MIDNSTKNALKNNVCRILIDDEHKGTGFLLNNEFIITANHVVVNSENIKVKFRDNISRNVVIFKSNDNDVVILKLNNEVDFYQDIEISYKATLEEKRWFSRGYPIIKQKNGLMMDSGDNKVQIIPLEDNYDMELEFGGKLSSYSGLSGSPMVVENRIVGIMMNELKDRQGIIELHGLSAKYFEDLVVEPKMIKDKKGIKNMKDKYRVPSYPFLVDRFDIRKEIEDFIKSDKRKFLIKYYDDSDDPKDIISWIKDKYKQLEYNFIEFEFSNQDDVNNLADKLQIPINEFRKENGEHHFQKFNSEIIEKNIVKHTVIKKMSKFIREIFIENKKTTLEILKDDLYNFRKIVVVLKIIDNNGKKSLKELYTEMEELLNMNNIQLIIIANDTDNMIDFYGDFFKKKSLNLIKKKDIKIYLENIKVKQSKINSFIKEIDKKNRHNDIKKKIWYDFNLNEVPVEGEKNAVR